MAKLFPFLAGNSRMRSLVLEGRRYGLRLWLRQAGRKRGWQHLRLRRLSLDLACGSPGDEGCHLVQGCWGIGQRGADTAARGSAARGLRRFLVLLLLVWGR